MPTEKVRIGRTDYLVKPEEGSLTVQSEHPMYAVHSTVIVHFTATGIEVIEDRTNAPEPWKTIVTPLRTGGFKVDTTGAVEELGMVTAEFHSMDSVVEYADAAELKKGDARVFSAIRNAVQAAAQLEGTNTLSMAQRKMIEAYKTHFEETNLRIG